MPDYKAMYMTLFHATTQAVSILMEAQRMAEEIYIASDQADIKKLEQSSTAVCSRKKRLCDDTGGCGGGSCKI